MFWDSSRITKFPHGCQYFVGETIVSHRPRKPQSPRHGTEGNDCLFSRCQGVYVTEMSSNSVEILTQLICVKGFRLLVGSADVTYQSSHSTTGSYLIAVSLAQIGPDDGAERFVFPRRVFLGVMP
jgi:hypothetical protein